MGRQLILRNLEEHKKQTMEIKRNILLPGKYGKHVPLNAYYQANGQPKPIVVFAHGFKGFKDWGHWHLLAQNFAKEGFVFLTFNFSHNGTTPENPLDFADLEAFGNNNFSKELADLDVVLNHLMAGDIIPSGEMQANDLTLIGHSRGGAIAVLKAAQDPRVTKLITWASVDGLDYAWKSNDLVNKWREKGVYYIFNSRTLQEMPLYFQLYEDFKANEERLNVEQAARNLNKPFLIVHGDQDPAVPLLAAQKLHQWCKPSKLEVIEGANHVFGGKHPFLSEKLPLHSLKLSKKSIAFLRMRVPSIDAC